MAQLNITLNQEEILELLTKNPGETFKELLRMVQHDSSRNQASYS